MYRNRILMKKNYIIKKFLLILILIIFLNSCNKDEKITKNIKNLKTDEDFIKFAKKADTIYISIIFIQNPSFHKSKNIKLPKIKKKEDIYNIMSPYWTSDFIEQVWKDGSKLMPKSPFGFYMEGFSSLLEAKDITISEKSEDKIIVTGKVPNAWAKSYVLRDLIIIKTSEGWKVSDWKFRAL